MTRDPLTCTRCGCELRGDLDTYGLPGQEMCWQCWFDDPNAEVRDDPGMPLPDDWPLESDDDEDDEEELIERDGILFCAACGMLAAPGSEEFDLCDHRTGQGCAYYWEQWGDEEDSISG